jgi:hypothetical protein
MYKGRDIENNKGIRAGVIPYTVTYSGHIWFLLARHTPTGELSDFGGGSKKDETLLQTAHREFMEESRCIFLRRYPTASSLKDSLVLFDKHKRMALFFVYIDLMYLVGANLQFKNSEVLSTEVSDVLWVDGEDFCQLVSNGKLEKILCNDEVLWDRIKSFFQKYGLSTLCKILNILNDTGEDYPKENMR